MKKVFAILLAVCALGVFMSGCGNKEGGDAGGTTPAADSEKK